MPKTTLSFYLHIIAVAVIVFAAGHFLTSSRTAGEGSPSAGDSSFASLARNDNKESVFDRVMRTGTIKCGYFVRPGFLQKDVNSGDLSGIAYDYVEELAKSLSLKVQWAEEIGGGDIATAFASGRIDAFCSAIWPTSARARAMDFVQSIAMTPLVAIVRADESRFSGDYDQLNNAQLKASYVDGTTMALMTQRRFDKAQSVSLPQLSALSEPLVEVAGGKADFALADSYVAHDYISKNPGKIKILNREHPVGFYPNALFIKQKEFQLKRMLDTATLELINTGVIDSIIKKYDKYPGTIVPVTQGPTS